MHWRNIDMTTFERLKKIAKEKGYSLKTLAVKAGLSENALYRYNQGVEPKYGTLKSVAEVLGVSVDYLLGNTNDTVPTGSNETPDMKRMLDNALTYDGKPLSDHDREVVRMFMETLKSED